VSYSFTVQAATKAEAKQKVAVEMAKVVQGQPIHSVDTPAVETAAGALADALMDDDTKDVQVAVHGSVSWQGSTASAITHAGATVNVSLIPRAIT
jgi:hypothetical protein